MVRADVNTNNHVQLTSGLQERFKGNVLVCLTTVDQIDVFFLPKHVRVRTVALERIRHRRHIIVALVRIFQDLLQNIVQNTRLITFQERRVSAIE